MYRKFFVLFFVAVLFNSKILAQEYMPSGNVLSISGKTVIAQFEDITISVGEEVEIFRSIEIVDPVSGIVRGKQSIPIAKGVIDDFGLGKGSIRITEEFGNEKVRIDDIVILTGKQKKIIRAEELKYGEIQEISEDTIITTLGMEDDISEGDIFLIQRTETIYDPETNEITGTAETNVGRLIVQSVTETSSVTRIIDKEMEPQIDDSVVKESEYLKYLAAMHSDSLKIAWLRTEVDSLKREIMLIKSTLDSLGYEQTEHVNDFKMLKNDIETVLSQLLSGDIKGSRIYIKNDEPINRAVSENLFDLYKQALDNCLDHKLQRAIQEFYSIIDRFPDSKLTENCRYWIAQSYFGIKDYPRAIEGFNAVINDKRFTHKDDDASIMLGITYYRMNKPDEALVEFQKFILNYPESEYKNKVNYWIERLKNVRG